MGIGNLPDLNRAHELYASVDLGGTKIACALAEADGRILGESTIPTQSHQGPEAVLQRIADQVSGLAKEIGRQPAALGMGVPGLADLQRGTTRFLPNLPTHWRDVPVREILSPLVGCPVYLLNDVRMATLGELTYGHGRTARTMAFLALGTGIGGGVAEIGPLLFDTVRETVKLRVRMFPVDEIRIERSLLGEKAGMLGGIALASRRGILGSTNR